MATPEPGLVLQRAIRIRSTPKRVLAAFFDPEDLAVWWDTSRAIALPRLLGPYAVQWPPTDYEDDVLGRLGGTLHGVVMDYRPALSFFIAEVYYHPPNGDPIGPMALSVEARAVGRERLVELVVRQTGDDEGPRWQRYFHVMGSVWERALEALRIHLEWSGVIDPRAR
ncbi:MAG: hypothetical protein IT179_20650 [Acidobacteria bacterium]|nr:hypothetical protein [Acidobacteriota bacterium]